MTEQETMIKSAVPVPEILWFSCDGMMVIDEHRRILAMNPALEQLLGCWGQDVVGKSECGVLFSCRDMHGCLLTKNPAECPGLKAMQRFEPVRDAEYTIRNPQGKRIAVSASYTPLQLPGRPVWALVVLRDMTLRKRKERRLIRQAMTDPLTSLSNRAGLRHACLKELKRAHRHSRPFVLLLVDLDGFKDYNDTYGHPGGDGLLKTLAGLLKAGRRTTDVVARYGGDEFALLLPETDAAGAMVVAERLRYTIEKFPFAQPETSAETPMQPTKRITASMGTVVFPEDGTTFKTLLTEADRRLYQAKRKGGNRIIGPP